MKFKMLDHISVRTRDGRQFSAMAERVGEVDDADTDMCDAIRSQVAAGLVEILPEDADAVVTDGSLAAHSDSVSDVDATDEPVLPAARPARREKAG